MARMAKAAGMTFLAVGLAALLVFVVFTLRDERYAKAVLLKDRNPGNSMYELQYFVAATTRIFLVGGAVAGALLALNGVTLMLVGSVAAGRATHSHPLEGSSHGHGH